MNIDLIRGQIAKLHITLDSEEPYELYGGTTRGAFSFERDGETWRVTAREEAVAGVPLCNYDIYARELATGREWVILSGKIIVKPRTASVPADKLHPVEYFVTVPVRNSQVDAAGNVIVQGIPGPKGEKGMPGLSAYQIALQNGYVGTEQEFTNMMVGIKLYYEQAEQARQAAVDAQILSEVSAVNALKSAQDAQEAVDNIEPYELTPESIQQVVPIAWENNSAVFGINAKSKKNYSVALGYGADSQSNLSITIGSKLYSGNSTFDCLTEAPQSITIGAGANTLNNGDTESSNSVTIGCKAENKGADSVVIGAQASNKTRANVLIGTEAKVENNSVFASVAIGKSPLAVGKYCVAVGSTSRASVQACAVGITSEATGQDSISIGAFTKAKANGAIAIGANANVSDYGATVIRSTAEDGTYTQLYFSGANTPLANTYENGEAMMGYVVRDSAGNIMTDAEGNAMVGTQKLSVLFPNNRGENAFTPAMLSMDEDWTPKPMFRPSDLDMHQEEPTEPEEYQPLPVYPIVEPEIEPLTE